jgi:hypothetical protein
MVECSAVARGLQSVLQRVSLAAQNAGRTHKVRSESLEQRCKVVRMSVLAD